MIVDDDSAIAEMYRFGLEHAGFDVTVVGNATGLFAALSGARADVVILDYYLPGLTGGEILERMQDEPVLERVPVLFLSDISPTEVGVVDPVLRAGARRWLEKVRTPPAKLAEDINEVLGAR